MSPNERQAALSNWVRVRVGVWVRIWVCLWVVSFYQRTTTIQWKRNARNMTREIERRADRPVSFQLLGAVEAYVDGRSIELGSGRHQRLLVALLAAEGGLVTRDRLMEQIWDDPQPGSARDDFYGLVADLRRSLSLAGLEGVLTSKDGMYRLDVPADLVDLHRFHHLIASAREVAGDDDQVAARLFGEALQLFRGEPLAGLQGHWVDAFRYRLTEERHAAELDLNEVAIRLGRHREQIPGLAALFRDRPADEGVAWLYMHALYRAGRQAEAQQVFHEVSKHLDRTIAVESLRALSDLYERMLRGDPGLASPDAVQFPLGRPALSTDAPSAGGGRDEPDGSGEDRDENTESVRAHAPAPSGRGHTTSITAQSIKTAQVFNDKVEIAGDWNVS